MVRAGRGRNGRSLSVWMNGERVGTWRIERAGGHEFHYEAEWLASASCRPLSLSMPIRPTTAPYQGGVVESYFDNLLPDSVAIRQRIQARFRAASIRAFDLLSEIGRDCVGAVQLLPEGQHPQDIATIDGEVLTDADVAVILGGAAANASLQGQPDDFRISLAGAQEKTALLRHQGRWLRPRGATPSTHIFKLPMGRIGNMQADFQTSVENEWLCARLARGFGLEVADCEIGQFGDQKALIVARFDRRPSRDGSYWLRLPQEDFCQVTGTPPALKYEADGGPGIKTIMAVLLGSSAAIKDRASCFRAQVVFWMLCALDGHAKNFSVAIEAQGRYRLTPLYDILSAYPVLGAGAARLAPQRAKLAMALTSRNRHYGWSSLLPRHWDATAHACGLGAEHSQRVREELAAMARSNVDQMTSQLPPNFPAAVAGPIFEGVLSAAGRLCA